MRRVCGEPILAACGKPEYREPSCDPYASDIRGSGGVDFFFLNPDGIIILEGRDLALCFCCGVKFGISISRSSLIALYLPRRFPANRLFFHPSRTKNTGTATDPSQYRDQSR